MNKSIILTTLILFAAFFISCNKDDSTTPDVYADESIATIENRTFVGRGACFELLFPVTILMPDKSEVTAESYINLRQQIRSWRAANPSLDSRVRPSFVFPISVITLDGETVIVNSQLELISLRRDCIRNGGGLGRPCFTLNFPLTVNFPDGTSKEFASPRALRFALIDWRQANQPNALTHPRLAYPLSITMEDGSIVTVNSNDELRRIKQDCN